jgi:hypothetical protein
LVKRAAKERRLVFSSHALDEMDDEGETRESVAAVLRNARLFTLQENGRWRIHAEHLTVIVHIEADTVVIWTVFVG